MKKPKILLFADYSNFHATLAKGLHNLGCDVTVVSEGSNYMDCARDIDIKRKYNGKLGGLLHASDLMMKYLSRFRGYDVVSFRDPAFLSLRPDKIRWFFNRISKANKACFLSYITTDIPFLDMLEAPDSPLRYSEYFIEGKPNRLRLAENEVWDSWHAPAMQKLSDTFFGGIKGIVTSLYEYHKSAERIFPAERIAYGGMPIDVDAISHKVVDRPEKIKIFLARDYKRKLQKGSDFLETAARNVVERHPDKAEFVMVENVPRKEYLEIMQTCHLMLDQIYSYTPATMALEGMASGLTVVSGAEPEFYDFIGEKENFPIINAPIQLEPLEKAIENAVLHPEKFTERSIRGREFVTKHNHMDVVAGRFLNFWQKYL